jgi:circadian clock protein KaiC
MTNSAKDSPRLPSGIQGLDEIMRGGIPRESLFLIEGQAGSGKTTLGLQILLHGAAQGETCMLVSNAETPAQLAAIADCHGWSLDGIHITGWSAGAEAAPEREQDYTLFPEAEVEVGETLQHLFGSIEKLQPTVLVLDSISALRVLAPTPAFYRRQLASIRDFLSMRSCTTVILDDATEREMDARTQTLADGILELRQVDFDYGNDRRRLRVRKLRGSGYLGGAHDFTIARGGIEVYPRLTPQEPSPHKEVEPLASGIAELDLLSGGGLSHGTSTLIMAPAGAGKSTLSVTYVLAAAQRGIRSAVLLFDESEQVYVARSAGLGLDLAPAMDAGLVRLIPLDPAELSPGQIAHLLAREVAGEGAVLVVIDTLNGYLQSGLEEPAILLQLRQLISYLGRRGVITLLTMTQHGILGTDMTTPVDVSFLADNVFLLRYFESGGHIRQALSMVKNRTGKHERTIRELIMMPGRISVSEPLEGLTGVLTGTPHYRAAGGDERR